MIIDITSRSDCSELVNRIRQTMLNSGYHVGNIPGLPAVFRRNDDYILEGLSKAILTRQAAWNTITPILPGLKTDFLGYNVGRVAALSDQHTATMYTTYGPQVKARFLQRQLSDIKGNARVFQDISAAHGSVWKFIESCLDPKDYDASLRRYIRPRDDDLIHDFADADGRFGLSSVGLAICCEFFNNVGIDEFKPDVHTTSFLNRIGLDRGRTRVSRRSNDVRKLGLTVAETLQKPRKYVDSHIWVFCAEGEAQICTEVDPKCDLCTLRTENPQLCRGWPSRRETRKDPLAATRRLKECSLLRKGAEKELDKAGVQQQHMIDVLDLVYGPEKGHGQGRARFTGIAALDQSRRQTIPTHFMQAPPEDADKPSADEVIAGAKITAPDGEDEPRREITRIGKKNPQCITGKGGPLDTSVVHDRFGAVWSESGTVLLIPIRLTIGQDEYDAKLHYRKKTQGLWIGSPLDDGKVKLAKPLAREGFKAGEEVRLRFNRNRIHVLRL